VCFSIIAIEVILFSFGAIYVYEQGENVKVGLMLEKQPIEKIDIIDSLTAPDEGEPVPQEIIDSLTAPDEGEPVPKEIMDSLTAPEE